MQRFHTVGKRAASSAFQAQPLSGMLLSQGLAFPGTSVIRNPPAIQETWVQPLGREDPLKKEMATHSNILAWEIPWTEKLSGLQVPGVTKSQTRLSD